MYQPFGTGELIADGYVLDVTSRNATHSTRLPLIVTDADLICGRRFVFGANDIAVASQLISALAVAKENTTEIVESPRFHILSNGSIGIEGKIKQKILETLFLGFVTNAKFNFGFLKQP